MRPLLAAVALSLLLAPAAASSLAADRLPALAPTSEALGDHDLVRDPKTGAVLLRFTNAIVNVGEGELGVVAYRDRSHVPITTMPAYQRIDLFDGSTRDEPIGTLSYHAEHKHFHLDGMAQYRLLDGDVIVKESPKVSFCLADVAVVEGAAGEAPIAPKYNACAHDQRAVFVRMGISVGWADVYGKDLVGQAFDVSDLMELPAKTYTLESTTDPDGILVQANGARTASVQVTIGQGVETGVGRSRPGV